MAPSPDPCHWPRCVLPAGRFSGPGTALGTAGGREWGAISCAPYPHPGLLDWWTGSGPPALASSLITAPEVGDGSHQTSDF